MKVKVLEVYGYAYVEENILKEGSAPDHAENPAAVLDVTMNGTTEKHTVFANFPDFPTVHGRPDSELGLTVQYRRPNSGSKGESHELRFVATPSGIQYQIQTGTKLQQGLVEMGREVATGWMDLQFRVEQAFPHAASDLNVTPLDDDDKSEMAASAIEIEIKTGAELKKFW